MIESIISILYRIIDKVLRYLFTSITIVLSYIRHSFLCYKEYTQHPSSNKYQGEHNTSAIVIISTINEYHYADRRCAKRHDQCKYNNHCHN